MAHEPPLRGELFSADLTREHQLYKRGTYGGTYCSKGGTDGLFLTGGGGGRPKPDGCRLPGGLLVGTTLRLRLFCIGPATNGNDGQESCGVFGRTHDHLANQTVPRARISSPHVLPDRGVDSRVREFAEPLAENGVHDLHIADKGLPPPRSGPRLGEPSDGGGASGGDAGRQP
jgi:hypothetical protein